MCKRFSHVIVLLLVLSLASGAWADLVGYWNLDEGDGTVAADSSGNGNDGALDGDPAWVDGQSGKALAFDNSRVAIPASDTLTGDLLPGEFTLVAWINPTRAGNIWQQVFRAMTASSSNDSLFLNNDGHLTWRGFVNGGWTVLCSTAPDIAPAGQWTHAAVVGDGSNFRIYVNGALSVEAARQTTDGSNETYYIGGDPGAAGESYAGTADEVALFNHALTEGEVQRAMAGIASAGVAAGPSPEDASIDVPCDVVLGWKAGEFAATHDVYLGTVFDDVNDASRADDRGVLVSQGQADASYDPDGLLDFGVTYYWRIDEVNAAPDNTIFKGDVWSLTAEPLGYPIEGVVATSNGNPQAGANPENAVNGSGLDADDQHSTTSSDMWLASPAGDEPMYIEFAFDRVYKMHEMLVWNYNSQFELMLGFGLKNVTVEYSENGVDWTVLGDVELTQATARADYTANTTIDLQGIPAQFVKLTVNSGFGTLPVPQYGLSEVRFLFIPAHAREAQPADEATDVSVATVLGWRAGRDAISHEVNLGTDPNALALAGTADAASFDPGILDLGTTYYWQVDAIQEVDSWAGDLWSFSTQAFLVVDDFESYTDDIDAGGAIFLIWIDGYEVNGNGSTVGHMEAPFAETTIVKSGSQSMPLFYDNTSAPMSEAELALAQNWTTSGVQSLALSFQGAAGNTGQLYVKINGTKVVYDGDASDIARAAWLPWNIDLSAVGGNLASVTSLIVGVEGAGATGVVYIDDIRLYPNAPELITPVEPDPANLVARFTFDGNANDSSGNGYNGTINGAPTYVAGVDGQAINFNGTTDYVVVGSVGISGTASRTISGWAKADTLTIPDWCNIFGFTGATAANDLSFDMNKRGGENQYCIHVYGWEQNILEIDLEWHHLAATYDGTTIVSYSDGYLVGSTDRELNTDDIVHMGKRAHSEVMWPGSVDEVRIYNQALSAGEIASLAGKTAPLHKAF